MRKKPNSLTTVDAGGKVQVLRAQYYGRAFTPHWHEEYAVGLIVDGVEEFEYRGATHRAVSQQVILMDAGEIHTGEAHDERGFAFHMLYIPLSSFREVAHGQAAQTQLHFREAVSSDKELADRLRSFHASVEQGGPALQTESLLLDTLAALLQRSGSWKALQPTPKLPGSLSRARDLLHDHLFQGVSLDQLADEAGVSKFHLLRAFRRQFGLPPHAYQLQQRVFHVKRMLENGRPVADIAIECGFADQSHLNRVFRSLVGTTPGHYAAQFHSRRSDR